MIPVGGLEHEFYFSIMYGNVIIPTDELIFFRGVGQPPTRYVCDIFDVPGPQPPRIIGCSSSSMVEALSSDEEDRPCASVPSTFDWRTDSSFLVSLSDIVVTRASVPSTNMKGSFHPSFFFGARWPFRYGWVNSLRHWHVSDKTMVDTVPEPQHLDETTHSATTHRLSCFYENTGRTCNTDQLQSGRDTFM